MIPDPVYQDSPTILKAAVEIRACQFRFSDSKWNAVLCARIRVFGDETGGGAVPMTAADEPPACAPRVRHLVELIELKAHKDPVAALAHLDSLAAHHPFSCPSPSLLFRLLRAVSASAPSHLPRLLCFLRHHPRGPRFSEAPALVALKAFSRALMPDEALRTFRSLPDIFRCTPGVRSHNALLDAFVRARRWDEAEVEDAMILWEQLQQHKALRPDSITYGVLIHGLCENGYINKALQELKKAEEGEDKILDVFAYTSLLDGLCKDGRIDEAICVYDQMAKCGCRPNSQTYNALISGFCRVSKIAEAIQFFNQMQSSGCSPTIVTYNTLISGLCKAQRFLEASVFTREMMEKGFKPDTITYSSLINGLCQDKKLDAALDIWNRVFNMGDGADVIMHNIVIHGLCSAGKVEEALRIHSEMKRRNCMPTLVTHNMLMDGLYKSGDCEKASAVWIEMLEAGLEPDIISYNIVLKGLCSYNRTLEAVELLDDALSHVLPQGCSPI
ncbi:hypothetical protein OPV22_017247 [Ensete ventricosum]|uniref:Pentacotripeptide-repeat region of PRORP domain-containing protein n=1 Tax=Ensete ventricosum TaxID=4639 RepID=A0AAV8QXJ5_ENSVE|nr:hypothetical protein OPV22_017247 [Ensete ventricosum]